MWVVGAAAVWLVGACATALVLGAVLRRGAGSDLGAVGVGAVGVGAVAVEEDPVVAVPAQRGQAPATPAHGLRSQAHLTCAGTRTVR